MAASRRSGKAKVKAKPRARSPSVVSETRAERRKRLERNERARERREEKKRLEVRTARAAEKKRAARSARARERRAEEKAAAAKLAKAVKPSKAVKPAEVVKLGKPALKLTPEMMALALEALAKQSPEMMALVKRSSDARAVEELGQASREKMRRAARNTKDRARRAARRRAKEEGPKTEAAQRPAVAGPPEGYEQIEGGEHPGAAPGDLVAAEMVAVVFREDLRAISKAILGRHRTNVYHDTAEVTGVVWRDAPDDLGDVRTVLGEFGEAFQASAAGLFYGETYFQGYATVVVAGGGKSRRKSDSPLNESRVGPDGKHYRTATTHWFRGNVQMCIATLGHMISRVLNGRPQFQLVKVGMRQYWSPIGRRPER